jgi:branched-chain amino acid aminotransferase
MSERVTPTYLWFNGEIVPWEQATLHATDTIWSSMHTVFEGIRAYWNAEAKTMYIFRLREHLRRLEQSMRLMRSLSPYPRMKLLDDLPLLLQRNGVREDTYIRVVSFPTARRLASQADEAVPNLLADTTPLPSHLHEDVCRHLMVSSYTRISESVMPPRVKTMANYRNSDLAMSEARLAGYDGPIMLNRLGEVAESAWTCIFIVRDGTLITPDLNSDLLESITRDTVLRLARERLGIPVVERRVARTELYLADEAFLCGTAAEIRPVGSIDRYTLGDGGVGPITRRLRDLYAEVVRGRVPEYVPWCTGARVPAAASPVEPVA